jgi:hypothetical protein
MLMCGSSLRMVPMRLPSEIEAWVGLLRQIDEETLVRLDDAVAMTGTLMVVLVSPEGQRTAAGL